MKKITLLFITLITSSLCMGQNLLTNGDFEAGENGDPVPSWGGFKNRTVTDNLNSAKVGQIENGDGSLFQEFSVTPGEEYSVTFDYRWISSASANSNLTVRIKNAANLPTNLDIIGGTAANGFALNTGVDEWFSASFSFIPPAGVTDVRLLMFKGNGNKPLNVDNAVVENVGLSVSDLEAVNFQSYPNPATNVITLSSSKDIDKVEIYNILGKKVIQRNLGETNNEINISELSGGLYIVKVFIEDTIGSYKLLKK